MRFGRRKITYYDTEAGFEAEKFAARLLLLLMNEMRASGRRQVVFLCIGTDRSTGDSLGPLIGSRLEAEEISNVVVTGRWSISRNIIRTRSSSPWMPPLAVGIMWGS